MLTATVPSVSPSASARAVCVSFKLLGGMESAFKALEDVGRMLLEAEEGVHPTLPNDDMPNLPPSIKRRMLQVKGYFVKLADRAYQAERDAQEADAWMRAYQTRSDCDVKKVESSFEELETRLEMLDTRASHQSESSTKSFSQLSERTGILEERMNKQDELVQDLISNISGSSADQCTYQSKNEHSLPERESTPKPRFIPRSNSTQYSTKMGLKPQATTLRLSFGASSTHPTALQRAIGEWQRRVDVKEAPLTPSGAFDIRGGWDRINRAQPSGPSQPSAGNSGQMPKRSEEASAEWTRGGWNFRKVFPLNDDWNE